MAQTSFPCSGLAVKCVKVEELETQEEGRTRKPMFDYHGIDQVLLEEMVYDALVWSSLHGLLVGDKFLDNTEDIVKLRKCFAGLWSLDDPDIVKNAIERPELFVMKPQREGGGNNIYGADVRETLLGLQKEGTDRSAAYILMQRIFPTVFPTFLMRDGICHNDYGISELGIYGAYLRYMCLAVILWKTANLP